MQLRIEQPHDHAAVRDIHRRAFGASGAKVVTLVDALRADDPAALGLVAALDGDVVGHVLLTRSLLDAPRRLVEIQVLSPLGVHPDHQRRGIGSALVHHGLQLLGERGVPLVFLEGSPVYYGRLGFTPGAARDFRKPSLRIPDEAFQVAALAAYEAWMTGTLVYAAPF